jgi:hypothetical protein
VTGAPFSPLGTVVIPITATADDMVAPPAGDHENVRIVVDNIFGSVADWLETAGAAVGTGLACTVGEVATMGADTVPCVAGVVATGALTGSGVNDTIDAAKSGD